MVRRKNFLLSIDIGRSLAQPRIARFKMGSAISARLPKYIVGTVNLILIGNLNEEPSFIDQF